MTTSALAQQPVVPTARIADDAIVFDRVAEASKKDLPRDLLKRIVNDDIDLLRGKRQDGSYAYATYERFEAGRTTQSFSVQPRKDQMQTVEVKGSNVYRVILDVPSRRLLVRKNVPIWVERVDIEMVPQARNQTDRSSVEVKAWLQPGEVKPIDLPDVARQATIRVIGTADEKGYSNLDVVLVQARIVDNADSPYANAVATAKAIQRSLDNNDIPSIRAMAKRLREQMGAPPRVVTAAPAPAQSTVNVTAPPDSAAQAELQAELQLIEDLLTGSESERREGLDRLHQLVRRTRR
ncbi:MAG TPA: hypothetical protein VKB93_19455 [Thermoanaerobaculia bacterium]|nr:hypothetical protein [Thermoanaerobaculia bacterium]